MNGVGQRRGKEWTNSGNKNDEKKQVVEIKEGRKEIKGTIQEVKEFEEGVKGEKPESSAERKKR